MRPNKFREEVPPLSPPEYREDESLEASKVPLGKDDIREVSTVPLGKDDIRILVLYPSSNHDVPLTGRYEVQHLRSLDEPFSEDDPENFEAISYTWETHSYASSVIVDGEHVPIPLNLQHALVRFRDIAKERRLWVDSVSIKMSNLEERANHILIMRRIYQNASRVLMWLGEDSKQCRGAIRFLNKINQTTDIDQVLRGNSSALEWSSVRALLLRHYFARAWVVQEVAAARKATIHIGSESIDWRKFVYGISIFDQRSLLYPTETPSYMNTPLKVANHFITIIRTCFYRDSFGHAQEPALSLEKLVFDLSGCDASDPRDKIYAFLAIAADIHPEHPEIVPDYSEPVEEVYLKFYLFCIHSRRSLDIILRPWNEDHPLFGQWRNLSFNSRLSTPLILAPGLSKSSKSDGTMIRNGPTINKDLDLCFIGYCFNFTEIHRASPDEDIPFPRSWLTAVNPKRFASVFLSSYSAISIEIVADTSEALEEAHRHTRDDKSFFKALSRHTKVQRAVSHISNLTRGRNLVWAGKDFVGLVPIGTEEDDFICITPHFSVPVVIRRLHSIALIEDVLIGECYLENYPKGEDFHEFWKQVPPDVQLENLRLSSWKHHPYLREKLRKEALLAFTPTKSKADSNISMAPVTAALTLDEAHRPYYPRLFIKGVRLIWTCGCGHKGFGHYIEHQPGAVKDFAERLRSKGNHVIEEPWDPFDLKSTFLETAVLRTQVSYHNLANQLCQAPMSIIPEWAKKWVRQSPTIPSHIIEVKPESGDVKNTSPSESTKEKFKQESSAPEPDMVLIGSIRKDAIPSDGPPTLVSRRRTRPKEPVVLASGVSYSGGSTNSSGGVAPSSNTSGNAGASQTQPASSAPVSSPFPPQGQSGGITALPPPPALVSNSYTVPIPQSNDYILLCFKVKKFFKTRHDLRLTGITRDRELFEGFRDAYKANFRWQHRTFSLRSVQKIKFVKFKLRLRGEIDNLNYGLPDITEDHYSLEPNPPEHTPAFDNDFLMHRFTCAKDEECLDDDICFQQIAKRMNGPVDPGQSPDLNTGWGMHLEEGYSARLGMVLLFGVVLSGIVGIIWSSITKDLQGGFVVAAWIVATEAVIVGILQILLYVHAI
ncbi:hypothetical protein IQ07DRAFT_639102 [Pyrenochaeta sp. DS3sAY3a]|nr:hypothetical protein IQ07DRAFT_639102 [Pyrenochaeta sp. DS3sAY3a]